MISKSQHVFARDREWESLVRFAELPQPGAMLGVVSGRRRQGKSFLLEAFAEATGGIYFPALQATEAISLRQFADTLMRHGIAVSRPFLDWGDAISRLFEAIRDEPRVVVIDEYPFLMRATPSLSSIIQRELGPGGSGKNSTARLILCGSSMAMMGKLLAGQAPLRGRASMELVIRPFDYVDAARFWDVTDPLLAAHLHAVVGGTPAYRRELAGFDAPENLDDFDDWVTRTVLNPQSPLFREARYLLAEETEIRDPGIYHSVLAAVAQGHTTSGGIAGFVGRKAPEIAHPLNFLEDAALLTREPDPFRNGRSTYRITEPLITFYQSVMWPIYARLETGVATAAIWADRRATYDKQVIGPHFESLCRSFAASASARDLFADLPADVRSGVINEPRKKSQIEIDVAVLGPHQSNQPRQILALGEAKWGERMGPGHVDRLSRARDLLGGRGYDVSRTSLLCFSATGGFTEGFAAETGADAIGLTLDDIYRT